MKDYYSILGLTKTATTVEIKTTFRKLARQYHPDLNPGDQKAEARFKEINEAYEVLRDAQTRQKYHDTLQSRSKTPRQPYKSSSRLDDFEFDRYENITDFINQHFKSR